MKMKSNKHGRYHPLRYFLVTNMDQITPIPFIYEKNNEI